MTETKTAKVEKVKSLYEKLADIQLELKAPKGQFNKFGNFYYRSCEDILEAVKPLLKGLVLTVQDEIATPSYSVETARFYVKATATITDGKDHVSVSAYAREAETKAGMDAAQITGAASSYARKYALNGLFLIDDTQDADTKDNSGKTPETPKTTKAPTTPTTPKTPETPKTPTTPTSYPASANQLAWVDKILKGRGERDQITDEQLKKLTSRDASAFISGKLKSEELFKVLGVTYHNEDAPLLDDIDLSVLDGKVE